MMKIDLYTTGKVNFVPGLNSYHIKVDGACRTGVDGSHEWRHLRLLVAPLPAPNKQPLTQLCIHIIKCVCISMSGGVLCSALFYPGIGDCCLITLYIQIYINNIYIYINPCAKIQFLFSLIHSEPVCTVGNLLYKSV